MTCAPPTHFGQMVVSWGGLALPSAEVPSNLKHREDEINTSHHLQAPHTAYGNWHCHPEGPGGIIPRAATPSLTIALGPWFISPAELKYHQKVGCLD